MNLIYADYIEMPPEPFTIRTLDEIVMVYDVY